MKKTIALVTGGLSGESVISYKSAATIEKNLDREKYDVYVVDINPEGWFYTDSTGVKTTVSKDDFSIMEQDRKIRFDAVLIGMHGTPGEDGKLQGYFDMLGIPYTGCDAASSAITFNKRYAVAVARMAGIGVANSLHLFAHTPVAAATIPDRLKLPVFVKPNNGGSSIGMSKVDDAAELEVAIAKAFKEDNQVLVEEMIAGREFTVGVYRSNGMIHVLPLTEVKAHDSKSFFDFEAKYEGKSTEVTPAVVAEPVAEKIRTAAKTVYEVFNCRGVIRIDFIYNEAEDRPYMLEVNTIPGQSAASIVPQQVAAAGAKLTDFYTLLVEECF
ncbi:D-alanine--D-alanine ligase [Niabella drilacis]|uniref:D-alanine--D-alanine ligase n=1 Tax=Niabella drilacis (strain DSM 25811 / CCM 8410 / CCUG 62505 / LMG 26954 / E90) TaxID=1285928 RepID=A0A1G6KX37_NIADE|nr:D-alanine--D-alanine ligase [Niabella drilacis]SDC34946.1 D-alanine-D-alanine ligase [Niabella drilacis]